MDGHSSHPTLECLAQEAKNVVAVILDKEAALGLQNPESIRKGLTPAVCLLLAVAGKGTF